MDAIASLLETLSATNVHTLDLLNDLSDERISVPYHRGINPPIWELGHSAFF
jgi:iron(II)-dependent oxidoreductase